MAPSVGRLALYFLRLGALGFGGPVALANSMRRDLVEVRGWLTESEYAEGLAIATACPGPLAYQLAVYCGWVKRGLAGALAVAVAFALAPFLLVVAGADLYMRYAATSRVRALFYGVAPVVIALILRACWKLGKKTLGGEVMAWLLAAIACAATVIAQKELTMLILAGGALGVFLFARPGEGAVSAPARHPARRRAPVLLLLAAPAAGSGIAGQLFLFFLKTGFLVFGSGLVIVPFLKTYVVDQYHWLAERPFLDSVAVGMISPGPVVITATFVGYLLDGLRGATAATVGIFTPPLVLTVAATPLLRRFRTNRRLQGFVRGVTVVVIGVLAGTTWLVGRAAIGDATTAIIAAAALFILFVLPRLPEPLLVGAGAVAGLIAYHFAEPTWILK